MTEYKIADYPQAVGVAFCYPEYVKNVCGGVDIDDEWGGWDEGGPIACAVLLGDPEPPPARGIALAGLDEA